MNRLFIMLVFCFVMTGCLAEEVKRGVAIIHRDAMATKQGAGDGHEIDRILEQSGAMIQGYGQPDESVLTMSATQAAKDQESKENATAIVANAGIFGGLFGGWLGTILGVAGSLGAIGVAAYTGNWILAGKKLMALFTEGIEEGKNNGELKKFLSSKTKGTWAGRMLDKYVVKAETTVGAKKQSSPTSATSSTPSGGSS